LTHRPLFAPGFDRACTKEQQLEEVAAIERQFGNLPLGDGLADAGAAAVQGDRRGFDFDRFTEIASLQLQIDTLDLVDVERHVGTQRDLEACFLRRDDVTADGKQGHYVIALVVRRRRARQAGFLVRDRDFDFPHHGTARILNGSRNLPGGGLGGGHARGRQEGGDDEAE